MPRPQDSPLGIESDPVDPFVNDNMLRMIRLRNMFDPNQPMDVSSGIGVENVSPSLPQSRLSFNEPTTPSVLNEEDELTALMNKLYQPSNEWESRYEQHVNNMPRREDNQPSGLRKVLASLYGGLTMSPSIASDIMNKPYQNKMADWETERQALEPGLNAERFSNTNSRQAASSQANAEIARRRAATAQQRVDDDKAADEAKNELEKKKLALKELAYNNPDLKFETREDGMLMGIHPRTGAPFETGLKTTEISEAEKIRLGVEGRIAVANVQGRNAIARTQEAGKQARMTVGERARLRREGLDKDKQLSVTQDNAAYNLARRQYIADNPHDADFWTPDGTPTSEAEEYEEYADAVADIRRRYNEIKARAGGQTTPEGKPNNVNTPPITSKAPLAPKGWKYVPKSDGSGWTAVEDK